MSGYALGQNEGSRSNDGFMGGNSWLWIIVVFALLFGWGGNFGGNNAGGGAVPYLSGTATRADINEGFALNGIERGIQGIQQGLCDSTYALNNAITGGFSATQMGMMQGFNGVERSMCDLSHQLSDCCCATQRAIDGVNYNMATQANALQQTMCNNTRDIIDATNAGTRAVLDFLTTDKISTLQAENQALRFQASQSAQNAYIAANQDAQTAELIRRLGRDVPVPAYVVPNPNCCYNSGCGNCM